MATEFLMPKLGLTMEEGTILLWLVADGAQIQPGTAVMLIETDKVESEVEASDAGRLHRIGEEGQTFRCGTVIGLLLKDGESAPQRDARAITNESAAATERAAPAATPAAVSSLTTDVALPPSAIPVVGSGERRFVSPNARRVAAERDIDLGLVRGTGPGGRVVSEDLEQVPSRPTGNTPPAWPPAQRAHSSQSYVPATAAARNLADLLGIDLTVVPPDPFDGYVTREAVARYVRGRLTTPPMPTAPPQTQSPQSAPAVSPVSQTPSSTRRMSGMRGTIAKRMFASLHEMAQLTLMMDADMDAVVADRQQRRAAGGAASYTDYVIAAVARALRSHPDVNAQLTADGVAQLPDIHIGMAVSLEGGLMVPVVRHADRLPLAELASATTSLAEAARQGNLALQQLEGGTFSVSALGMFGVDGFTPVINPPNVAILGVGRIRDDLILLDGVVSTTKRMTLSLTWDHRVLDGAPAAEFCKTIVSLLNEPSLFD